MTQPAAELAEAAELRQHHGATSDDSPLMLTVGDRLAYWLSRSERYGEALETIEGVIVARARVLGSDHRDTLDLRHNQAFWVGESGLAGKAAMRLAEVVADEVRVSGFGHPETYSQSDHVSMLGQLGNVGEATQLCRDMLRGGGRLSDVQRAELLRALLRHAMAGVPAERRRVLEPT